MTSIFPIAYGFSKFLSGVLGARSSPRIMLASGLMATAIINVMFGFGKSMTWFCFFWALNGILQVGWAWHAPLPCTHALAGADSGRIPAVFTAAGALHASCLDRVDPECQRQQCCCPLM